MIKLGPLRLEPAEFGSQGSAVLGIRDSGKTYTATLIAELLFGAGIPFIAFDPIGVWRYLRIPGKGKGIPVVVAGGEDPDIPLTPQNAPAIVEAAMQQGVSLVIDLFDMKLSKADWKRIVRDCVQVLLHKNKEFGLRHVFLEEAAEFAPQNVGRGDGEVYAAIEKLARMGGNSRLGYTLISQRSQEVNKAVLELCDNLFLHRQKGLNALANAKKWLDVAGATAGEVMAALPTLPQGECFAWLSGSDLPIRMKVPAKNSLHPDRRVTHSEAAKTEAKRAAVNVDSFVEKLRGQLASLDEEMKANDPKVLRGDLAAMRRERDSARQQRDALQAELDKVKAAPKGKAPASEEAEQRIAALEAQLAAAEDTVAEAVDMLNALLPKARRRKTASRPAAVAAVEMGDGASRRRIEFTRPAVQPRAAPVSNGTLPPGEFAILVAAVQYGTVDRDQLSVLTGYKTSSRNAYIARLRDKGLVETEGQKVRALEGAREVLGDAYEPLPEGKALQDYWMARLPVGEAAVLNALIENHPAGLERPEIDEKTGYKVSSRNAYISRLGARRLVEVCGNVVKASETLF